MADDKAKILDISTGKSHKTVDEVYKEFNNQKKKTKDYFKQIKYLLEQAAAKGVDKVYQSYKKTVENSDGKEAANKFLASHMLEKTESHAAIAKATIEYKGQIAKQLWGTDFEKLDQYAKDHIARAVSGIDTNTMMEILGSAKGEYTPATLISQQQKFLQNLEKQLDTSTYTLIDPKIHGEGLGKKMELHKSFDDLSWLSGATRDTIGGLLDQYDNGKKKIDTKQFHGTAYEAYLNKDSKSKVKTMKEEYKNIDKVA